MYFLESDTFVMRLGRVCKAWSADLSGAEWVQEEPRRSARTLSPHERRSLRRGHIRRSRPLPPRPAPAFNSGAFAPLLLLASQPTCRSVDRVSMILDMLRRSRVAPSHHAPTPRSHARNASGMMQPRCVRTERSPRSFTAAAAAQLLLLPPRCALSAPLAACWQRGSSFSSFSPARQHVSQASPTPSLTPPHSAAPPPSRHRGHGVLYMCMYMHMYVLLLAMGIPGVAGTVTLPVGMPPSNPSYPRPCYGPPLGLPPLTGLPQASPL
jgi:hypothetical protein